MSTKVNKPIISIITINYNNAEGLSKTINSVYTQTDIEELPVEYIIIDGKSSDNSVDIIKQYISEKKDIISYFCSEKDSGIYNAMNKGIRKAKGNFCLFLNSGDYLISSNTLTTLLKELSTKKGDIFYSDLYSANKDLCITYPDSLNISFFFENSINHQNSLIKRSLFKSVNMYDESYQVVSDVKFFAECAKANKKFIHIQTPIAVYDSTGGISATVPHEDEIIRFSGELYPELLEHFTVFHSYRNSIYTSILKQYGHPKSLDFVLRVYRFVYRFFHIK